MKTLKSDSRVLLFYKRTGARRWVCAVARRLNDDGFLITTYLTDVVKEGDRIWVKVLYDEIGNTLTVWFGNPADEYVCEETGEEVILMKDKEGRVIGFEKLNYVADRSVGFQVGFQTAGAGVAAQPEREPDA